MTQHAAPPRRLAAWLKRRVGRAPRVDAADFVRSLYEVLLQRTPGPDEIAHWVARWRATSAEAVYFEFVRCEEFARLRALPKLFVPPGHYYSPVVDPAAIRRRADAVFAPQRALPGIDLREAAQLALLARLATVYPLLPYAAVPAPGMRYGYDNPSFGPGDAIALGGMILLQRPRQIIEVGSGHSSAAMLDVVERHLPGQVALGFVEPFPNLFHSLLRPGDRERVEHWACGIQDVDLAVFDRLAAGDILFIDSTHIVKTDSDVVHHLTRVLPRLAPGVLVHFHDVFHPFEYPQPWVIDNNQSWNELYVLQAFLTNNAEYEILLFNDYLGKRHRSLLERLMPDFVRNPGGSLWLRKRPPSEWDQSSMRSMSAPQAASFCSTDS